MRLYGYWRSSAAYRLRIALNLKGVAYDAVPVDLRAGGQRAPEFLAVNPQGIVPCLEDGATTLTQSLAIIEYLEETRPDPPLLPSDPAARARVRAIALAVACEMHPLNNLKVLQYLEQQVGVDEEGRRRWYHHWIAEGFGPLERILSETAGTFAFGDRPTLADVCLVPQVANAHRYRCDMAPYPTIRRVNERCLELPAFATAAPERQPDAPPPKAPAG